MRAIAAMIVIDADPLPRKLGPQLPLAEEFERARVTLLIVSHLSPAYPPAYKIVKPIQQRPFPPLRADNNLTTTGVKFGKIQRHDVRVSMTETAEHSRRWSTQQSQVA
jgi:hypothetical protein